MRILSIALAAAVSIAGPASAQQTALRTSRAHCNPAAGVADHRGKVPAPRKLGEMPPAKQIYTVYNEIDGCLQPVAVRKGVADALPKVSPTRSPPRAAKAR